MSDEPSDVAFHDYPNVDFTPRFPFPASVNGHVPKPPARLSFWLRVFRFFRKLVRQRQESAAVKSVRWQARDDVSRERNRADEFRAIAVRSSEQMTAAHQKEIESLTKSIEQRDASLSELRQQMDRRVLDLEQTIRAREKDIKSNVELEIPKLKRELEVERCAVKYWKTLVAAKLIQEEAQIAVDNSRIADAETRSEQMRQAQSLAQLMDRTR